MATARVQIGNLYYTEGDLANDSAAGVQWVCFHSDRWVTHGQWDADAVIFLEQSNAWVERDTGASCYTLEQLAAMLAAAGSGGSGGGTGGHVDSSGIVFPPKKGELPDPLQFEYVAVVPGPPVVTVVVAVVSVLASLFGLFRRGGSTLIGQAVEGLRAGLAKIADELARFSIRIAHFALDVLNAVRKVWDKGIKPALKKIEEIEERARKVLNKVLYPYLQWMQRIRQIILDYYNHVVRPIIEIIQRVRKVVAILKVLRVPFAKKLDERLVKLEEKLIAPITALLRRINDHGSILNWIVTLGGILQRPIFTTSILHYRASWIATWWNEQIPDDIDVDRPRPPSIDPLASAERSVAMVKSDAGTETMLLIASVNRATDRVRQPIL